MNRTTLKRVRGLILIAFTCSLSSMGFPQWELDCKDGGLRTVISAFKTLSSIPRRAYEEPTPAAPHDPVNQLLRDLVEDANRKCWGGEKGLLSIEWDSYGNAMLIVPPTGRFLGKTGTVALQAHTDMVWNVAGEPQGADLSPWFENGVDLVFEEDGWVHSRNYQTTVGFDDGMGVAVALRYAMVPALEHPRLKILLTRDEETGLFGASALDFDVSDVFVLFNLDSEKSGVLVWAAMGQTLVQSGGEIPASALEGDFVSVELDLSGLTGGHSGLDIHLNRASATAEFFKFVDLLYTQFEDKDLALTHLDAGAGLTAIPTRFTARFSVRREQAAALKEAAESYFDANWFLQFSDESSYAADAWKFRATLRGEGDTAGLRKEALLKLSSLVQKTVGQGVLERHPDYHAQVKTAVNLGLLKLHCKSGQCEAELVAGIRSYSEDSLRREGNRRAQAIIKAFPRMHAQAGAVFFKPWLPAEEDWLRRLIRAEFSHLKHDTVNGTLELSVFPEAFSTIPKLSWGFDLQDAHTPRERGNMNGVAKMLPVGDALIQRAGALHLLGEVSTDNCIAETAAEAKSPKEGG